jgi:hypothetical protein
MPRANIEPMDESFSVELPGDLKAAFVAAAAMADRPAAEIIRDLMRSFIEDHPLPEPGHDEWFRAQVQAALDDPRPSIPHDVVMARARQLLDRISAEKRVREG